MTEGAADGEPLPPPQGGRGSTQEERATCWARLQSLEHWLRRLVDDTLTPLHGDLIGASAGSGTRLVSADTARNIQKRRTKEPGRYARTIDAFTLGELVGLIVDPELFIHFEPALDRVFPLGAPHANAALAPVVATRNRLAHGSALSVGAFHEAMHWTHAVTDALTLYYRQAGMHQDYDAPLILRLTDSFGNTFERAHFMPAHEDGIMLDFSRRPELHLRPGHTLTLDVEVDPAYDAGSYEIRWVGLPAWAGEPGYGRRVDIPIEEIHTGGGWTVQCYVTAKRDWHRMSSPRTDDFMSLQYRVLRPLP